MIGLIQFVRESNLIEGIDRDPTEVEIAAHERLLGLYQVTATALGDFQSIIAPGKPLREKFGMDVRVGNYIAPHGGPNILRRLQSILRKSNDGGDPWNVHIYFEKLHPYMDGNGRTGRALWAWQMKAAGRDPFALPFLHRWYYETLDH